MRTTRRAFLAASAASASLGPRALARLQSEAEDERVVVVTLDGLRPEEVFTGAEGALLNARAGVTDVDGTRTRFWRETPEARREALLPFLWGVVASQGQIYGNKALGSVARVTNGKNFSYPGYNELFTGAPDDRIDSNNKVPNPNINVFEWLLGRPGFAGRVAAFCCWDVFPFILNRERSGLLVHAGWEPLATESPRPGQVVIDRLLRELPRAWGNSHYDALAFEAALEHLESQSPRVLYIAFGETDEFAHEGRYDRYLDAAARSDAMLATLWERLQALPEYRGKTSLLVTTDHGRGGLPDAWKHHGAGVAGADTIWIAVLGSKTPAMGERRDIPDVTQSQVGGTIAALAGEREAFQADFPRAAPPIIDVLSSALR